MNTMVMEARYASLAAAEELACCVLCQPGISSRVKTRWLSGLRQARQFFTRSSRSEVTTHPTVRSWCDCGASQRVQSLDVA